MATLEPALQKQGKIAYSHVHLYVDKLEDLNTYKNYEDRLNEFFSLGKDLVDEGEKRALWQSISGFQVPDDPLFVTSNRDVVRQLLAGLGFRITAARYEATDGTRSVLVTSRDQSGVQILVTAAEPRAETNGDTKRSIYDRANLDRFLSAHNNRQGIAVLGFIVEDVEKVRDNYRQLHPALIANYDEASKILEVFAYYKEHETDVEKVADPGTLLRFTESSSHACPLGGLTSVAASFPDNTQPAYCDHWVSNVFGRTEFINTLHDTLGFTAKVDFNAGVVAAGEAQIESTVIGNDSALQTTERLMALKDQSQVYLPINNALSSVGHVHGFLREIGQGIQHLASRVEDLVDFVQTANHNRKVFGEGFTFLNIPRSYYGILSVTMLNQGITDDKSDGVSLDCANAIFEALLQHCVVEADGAVDLDVTDRDLRAVIEKSLAEEHLAEFLSKADEVLAIIMRSRYCNLYSLLRDQISEDSYLRIVRNKILVDIQGEDLLYQIFTCNILQRQANDEAPFFEFIQRVCSECHDENGCPRVIRPGCGGFGIRNFLTLFLSIEVSKAMRGVITSKRMGDDDGVVYSQKMVDYFTAQMNEANPILTRISNAMTEEGRCRDKLLDALISQDSGHTHYWRERLAAAGAEKDAGNRELMECSARYNALMKQLREARNGA